MIRANVIEDREAIMARFLNGLDANLVITQPTCKDTNSRKAK
jgi:hypothetical protein